MHVVTKFLVVAAAVLAVLLAGLTIAYSINADTIVKELQSERDLRQAQEAELNSTRTRQSQDLALREEQLQSVQAELAARDQRIIQLEGEVAQLRTDKRDAEITAERITNQIGQSQETTRVQAKMIDAYRVEIAQLRDQELETRAREIALEDALNDAQSRNEVLQQTARALQEQLKEMENQVASGGTGGEGGTLAQASFGALQTIKGRIVEARQQDSTGETLVEMDIGENDGLEVGMVLAAWRGTNEYLANVEVIRVDLQSSVGRVQFYKEGVTSLRAGDRVATNLR